MGVAAGSPGTGGPAGGKAWISVSPPARNGYGFCTPGAAWICRKESPPSSERQMKLVWVVTPQGALT